MPPGVASFNVVVLPTHTDAVPVIAATVLIVTIVVDTQPVGSRYDIVEMPAVKPFTTPLVNPIVATPGTVLLQVPPARASASVVLVPVHIDKLPVMGATGLTVTIADILQPAAVV